MRPVSYLTRINLAEGSLYTGPIFWLSPAPEFIFSRIFDFTWRGLSSVS